MNVTQPADGIWWLIGRRRFRLASHRWWLKAALRSLTALCLACLAPLARADTLSQPEAPRVAIAPGLIRLQLSRNVMIDVPRDWSFRDPTIQDWIHKAAGDAIDISGSSTQHKAGSEFLLLAISDPGKTAAVLGLAFTPAGNADNGSANSGSTGAGNDPAQIADAQLQTRLIGIDGLMHDTPVAEVSPLPVTRFVFPGKARYPAVSVTYIHSIGMDTVLTQIWSIWRPDGIVTLTLSYPMTEADKWSPVMHQIGDSLIIQ